MCLRTGSGRSFTLSYIAATTTAANISTAAASAEARRRRCSSCAAMENTMEERDYSHYNHTDPCKHLRWTTRECHQYMYRRPWQRVSDFYSDLVRGKASLSSPFAGSTAAPATNEGHQFEDAVEIINVGGAGGDEEIETTTVPAPAVQQRTGRWARTTFKIVLSYHGCSFDGWQKQPGLNTVQGLVEKSLGRFVDEKKANLLRGRSMPVEGCALVAGRTDKGVTAVGQVCSFYTWRKEIKAREIEDMINNAAPGQIRTLSISEVSRVFHPNFSAKWRRYFYIFPLDGQEDEQIDNDGREGLTSANEMDDEQKKGLAELGEGNDICLAVSDGDVSEGIFGARMKPKGFSIDKVNRLIRQLEGKSLSYKMFARDTKASRSTGPPTECYVFHARAAEARLPCDDKDNIGGQRVMCVELVANRFLRRMVRVLVATSIREAAAGSSDDILLKLMDATCRRATAPPAPPDGLCLANVGYREFKQENCLILK